MGSPASALRSISLFVFVLSVAIATQVAKVLLESSRDPRFTLLDSFGIVQSAFSKDSASSYGNLFSSLLFFWKGYSAFLWARYPFALVEFSLRKLFEKLLEKYVNRYGTRENISPHTTKRLAIIGADIACTALFQPVSVVRTRLIAQPRGNDTYLSAWDAAIKIGREGSLFSGLGTTILHRFCVHLSSWELSHVWNLYLETDELPEWLNGSFELIVAHSSLVCAERPTCVDLAPLSVAQVAAYPLTTIRTQQMLGASPGLIDTFRVIMGQDGFVGLYRGILADVAHSWTRYFAVKKAFNFLRKFYAWQVSSPSLTQTHRMLVNGLIATGVIAGLFASETLLQLEHLRKLVYA